MQDWKAQEAARAAAAAAISAAYPHLVRAGDKVHSLNAAAKNIRIELKLAFPKVKFSVRSSRFSGGDSISVGWTDGPNADQVEQIVCRYKAGSFNGMEDIYEYSRDARRDAFGDAKYISTERTNSRVALDSAARTVRARRGSDLSDHQFGELVRREAYRRTWAIAKPLPAPVCDAEEAAV